MAEHPAGHPSGSPPETCYREELEKLRQSERFLRSILETQEELLCRFLPDTTLTYVNEPYCRMFGRTAKDLLGTRFLDLIPDEGRSGVMETISQLSVSNRSVTYSHQVRLPDGQIGWQQWTDTAIIDSNGNVAEIQSTGRDITRQKMVEQELLLQTRLQELLMNISATYISIPESEVDEAIHKSLAELGQFVGADRFYIFDYDFERNTSTNTYEWCAPGIEPQIEYLKDYPNEHIPDWVNTHRKGEIMHVPNVQALPRDSSIRQMLEPQGIRSLIAVPMMDRRDCFGFAGLDFVRQYHTITDNERKLLTIFAQMMVNVQNRLRTQKSLHENERFLADLIDKSPSIIAVKNTDGTYQLVNQTWQDITGIQREDALGRTDTELFDPNTARSFMKNDQYVLETGETVDTEEALESGSDKRHFLSTKFPVRDVNGTVTAVCGMIFDITDRKKAEEHRIARTEAEAANHAKTTFLSNMSHEIRTPLNAIVGFARVLERDMTLSEKQGEQIRTIRRSSEHLLNLVNQTLDYSRLEAGAETLNPTRFRTRRLVDDMRHMFAPMANRIGLQYSSDVAREVPEFILADESRIRQVLVNLLSNALKVTEKGAVTIRVSVGNTESDQEEIGQKEFGPEVSGQKESGPEVSGQQEFGPEVSGKNDLIWLIFEVEDTGPGIPKDQIKHLFSKYFQLKEGLRAGGSGLGLPIVRKLAYLMNGNIEVESTPGKGSCFRLILPVSVADRTDLLSGSETKRLIRLAKSAAKSLNVSSPMDDPLPGHHIAAARKLLTREAIACLPASLIRQVRAATLEGDMIGLRKLADSMDPEHTAVSAGIRGLAAEYDYDTLLDLFEDT